MKRAEDDNYEHQNVKPYPTQGPSRDGHPLRGEVSTGGLGTVCGGGLGVGGTLTSHRTIDSVSKTLTRS